MPEPEPAARPARAFGAATPHRKLSVIVPIYNERNTVAEIVRRMRNVELDVDLEVVLVDDGSDDGTRALLPQLADSTVRIVKHDRNRGKGAAIRTGLANATGDMVLVQDADLEYDPDEWPKLLAPLQKGRASVVYGTRFRGERRAMPLSVWLGNRILVGATNVLYNTTLSDVETGYKLFDRSLLDRLHLTADGFDFEPEVTARVLRAGERIYEVPVSYTGRARAEGRKITWRDNATALWTLITCRFGR